MLPQLQKSSKTTKADSKVKIQDVGVDKTEPMQVSVPVYISMVGVHATMLGFAGLFLPRSAILQELARFGVDASPVSSRDRPQHPFLEDLTRNATTTLFALCLGAAIIQTWWALWLKRCLIDSISHGTPEDRLREKYPSVVQRAKELVQAYGVVVLASLVLHFLAILFGAPITKLVVKTYLFALLVSTLTVFPAAYILGPPTWFNESTSLVKRWTWVRLFAEFSPRNTIERALVYPFVGVAIGSWLGIIPIALDWDRPWQAWPLTPAYGALSGYIVSSITAVTVDAIVSQKPI